MPDIKFAGGERVPKQKLQARRSGQVGRSPLERHFGETQGALLGETQGALLGETQGALPRYPWDAPGVNRPQRR
jgi:hypothetical protein